MSKQVWPDGWGADVSRSEESPEAKDIHANLRADVEAEVGPSNRLPLCISLKDERGELAAGVRGFSHWGWLYISHLWVRERDRSLGLGAKLVSACETEALARGCTGLYVDTFNAKASRFYERCGFTVIGRIEEFPPGHQRIYLAKRF